MNLFRLSVEQPSLQPPIVFHIGSFPVTSSFLAILLILALVVLFAVSVRRLKEKPTGYQSIVEMLYEGMHQLIQQVTNNTVLTNKIFPLIASLFVFIGISNVISLIPGFGSLEWNGVALFRSPTSDFNTTFALAFALLLVVQVQSIRDWGLFGYLGRFVQVKNVIDGFKKGVSEGMVAVVQFFIGLLDIVSELAKIVSLSVRLFGNIFAGEMMMVILLGSLAYILPAAWMFVNGFIGIVQAIVFGALVAVYYTVAMNDTVSEKE